MSRGILESLVVASFLVFSSLVTAVLVAGTSAGAPFPVGTVSPATTSGAVASVAPPPDQVAVPAYCSTLETAQNDPGYAAFVQHVRSFARGADAAGLPAADVHLPYAGPIPDQTVDGIAMAGSQLSSQCDLGQPLTSQTQPTGVSYDGQIDRSTLQDVTLDANSIAGILTVNSPPENFYPGSGTPTVWGAQENVVLTNVTLLGSRCPQAPCAANGSGNYAFWVQNVLSYDSYNDSLYFVDDTWNFTSYTSEMFNSSLVRWSPNGGNYTGTWVAFSRYYHVPTPFTVTMYVNTSVDSAGDQVLWYNYSVRTPTEFIGNGNYDYLVFDSQPAGGRHHHPLQLSPPDFEASATTTHVVNEGYELDAFIGADDGSNQLMFAANATMKVQYCVHLPYCTPSSFAFANVPAAVNYGSQTGEQTIGIAVNFVGSTAYLSAGPLITHGLWNYTAVPGVRPGATKVTNVITVSGDPEGSLATQPYVFVFFENRADQSEGFQWAPDVPAWLLMPGTYVYQVMLADYSMRTGTITVGSAPTTLRVALLYNPRVGVYTPLWAFGNGELAGISFSGRGTVGSQYLPFNNPTTGYSGFTPQNLSANFLSADDYLFPSFPGVLFEDTSAYVDLNAPPTFTVSSGPGTYFYLGLEFFQTSNLTLSNDANLQGWNSWSEISFYITVPASQNPVPQADLFVWNSTGDLILSNDFVGTAPTPYSVAPTELVLYGGTNNVVWGNTFTDAVGVVPNVSGQYAGIGLGEAGDLIYNNNFSVDNPVVYLPYNWPNVADCLPQTLGPCEYNVDQNGWYYNDLANVIGSRWNVTPESAANVVNTVNGFALSGNVLGPDVTTQGGNYYWNYGTSPNNYSTIPYVSRFYYSNWSNIFPLGCGSIQAPNAPCGTPPPVVGAYEDGITAGGDYAPYGPTVTFAESGLPSGTAWTVTIDGQHHSTRASAITLAEPFGTYHYTVSARGFRAHPSTGSVLVSGVPTVHVVFSPVRYGAAGGATPAPSPPTTPIARSDLRP